MDLWPVKVDKNKYGTERVRWVGIQCQATLVKHHKIRTKKQARNQESRKYIY